MSNSIKIGAILFLAGLIGVLSLLTIRIPLTEIPPEVLQEISLNQLRYLVLINPAFLLLISVIIGGRFHDKVGLSVPYVTSFVQKSSHRIPFSAQFKYGFYLGIISGVLITGLAFLVGLVIPEEFKSLQNNIVLTFAARILYGGITEEILMRYGLMTLIVWISFKINKRLTDRMYWFGICITAIIFALGHFPVLFNSIPNPSIVLLLYVLIGNSIAGIFFGWLYWKKGLESAMLGHMFFHIAVVGIEKLQLII